jgi:hypothetical protein
MKTVLTKLSEAFDRRQVGYLHCWYQTLSRRLCQAPNW